MASRTQSFMWPSIGLGHVLFPPEDGFPVMPVFTALVFMPETQTLVQEATPDTSSVLFRDPPWGQHTGCSGLSSHSPGRRGGNRWRLEQKAWS